MTKLLAPDSAPTDESLMAALRAGDDDGLAVLAERYRSELSTWALRVLGDHHAAEDAVQETLLAVWRFAHTYQPGRSFRVWLRTVAINCANAGQERPRADHRIRVAGTVEQSR